MRICNLLYDPEPPNQVYDSNGSNPLHLICLSPSPSARLFNFFKQANPKFLTEKNNIGKTPKIICQGRRSDHPYTKKRVSLDFSVPKNKKKHRNP